jgi:hypothetical protein
MGIEMTLELKDLLDFHKKYQPLCTVTEDLMIVEYNVIDENINTELDQNIRNAVEKLYPNFKWFAQGVDLSTKRRDISFKRED